jgi:hypothetical protein
VHRRHEAWNQWCPHWQHQLTPASTLKAQQAIDLRSPLLLLLSVQHGDGRPDVNASGFTIRRGQTQPLRFVDPMNRSQASLPLEQRLDSRGG